ncbi:hypothetical protein F4604DRAFT_1928987 [Suillus subluteus]|nr:hypothetical protein F4604DRAFT_1928987 [Suillus subluteus]
MGPQNNLYCSPASACKIKAEQVEVRSKMRDFRRQLEVRVRAREDVVEMDAAAGVMETEGVIDVAEIEVAIDVVETEVAVDIVEQWMKRAKKWLGAVLKGWFNVALKKRLSGMSKKWHVAVKEEGGNTTGEGCAQGDA